MAALSVGGIDQRGSNKEAKTTILEEYSSGGNKSSVGEYPLEF